MSIEKRDGDSSTLFGVAVVLVVAAGFYFRNDIKRVFDSASGAPPEASAVASVGSPGAASVGEYSGIYRYRDLGGDATKGRLKILRKSGNDVVVLLDPDKESSCALDFQYEVSSGGIGARQVWKRYSGAESIVGAPLLSAVEERSTDCQNGDLAFLGGELTIEDGSIDLTVKAGLKRDRKKDLVDNLGQRVREYGRLGTFTFVGSKLAPSSRAQSSK